MLKILSMSKGDPTTKQLLFDDGLWRRQIMYALYTPHCYAALHTFCITLESPNDVHFPQKWGKIHHDSISSEGRNLLAFFVCFLIEEELFSVLCGGVISL